MSRPVRGAWIETYGMPRPTAIVIRSRPVRGAWIETAGAISRAGGLESRAPCGARGLKPRARCAAHDGLSVAPRAGRVD